MLKWPGRSVVQIMCNTSSAYHMQHAIDHMVRGGNWAIKFDRVEIIVILAFFIFWNYELMKEVRIPKYPEKNPDNKLQKNPYAKAWKWKPELRLESTL